MLQIRNNRVDELATRLATLRGRSKTEIVLDALEREWERLQKETTLEERLRPLQDFVASHPKTGDLADKAFFDDLSEEE
jgi:antitoxin VapB